MGYAQVGRWSSVRASILPVPTLTPIFSPFSKPQTMDRMVIKFPGNLVSKGGPFDTNIVMEIQDDPLGVQDAAVFSESPSNATTPTKALISCTNSPAPGSVGWESPDLFT